VLTKGCAPDQDNSALCLLGRTSSLKTRGDSLTMVVYQLSLVIEQATSSYSFRFPELSQPI